MKKNLKNKKSLNIAMLGHKRIPSREGGIEIVVEELAKKIKETKVLEGISYKGLPKMAKIYLLLLNMHLYIVLALNLFDFKGKTVKIILGGVIALSVCVVISALKCVR